MIPIYEYKRYGLECGNCGHKTDKLYYDTKTKKYRQADREESSVTTNQ